MRYYLLNYILDNSNFFKNILTSEQLNECHYSNECQ